MRKRYPAQHLVIFAVYQKFMMLGNACRFLKIAFPDRCNAEEWVEEHCKNSFHKKEDYMIEEMPAIMKAWQP